MKVGEVGEGEGLEDVGTCSELEERAGSED